MIKVIIADDEEKVCQLIYNLIDWKEKGMEVIGVVHDGIEALQKIKEEMPDILITDIRMPGCDGLELIERAKEINKNLECIVISGYSHFEYARQAIQFGVNDYLLKPINQEELSNSLTKISEICLSRTMKITTEEQMKRRLKQNITAMRTNLIENIVNHKMEQDQSIEEINEEYNYQFGPGCYQILIFKIDTNITSDNKSNLNILKNKIIEITNQYLKDITTEMESYQSENYFYVLLNYDKGQEKAIRRNVKAVSDDVIIHKSIIEHIEFTIGCGKVVYSFGEIEDSLDDARLAIEERVRAGCGKVIEDIPHNDCTQDINYLVSRINREMDTALEILDKKEIARSLNNLADSIGGRPNMNGCHIIRIAKDVINIYTMLLRKYKLSQEDTQEMAEKSFRAIDELSSVDAIFSYINHTIGSSLDRIINEKEQEQKRPVRMARQYINENYMHPISLEEVSKIAGFNSTYFSTLFKKETEKTFQEYLVEVRMNKTKELLKETNIPIASICEQVGYNDIKSFQKNFKKATGISPNQYRKLYA